MYNTRTYTIVCTTTDKVVKIRTKAINRYQAVDKVYYQHPNYSEYMCNGFKRNRI